MANMRDIKLRIKSVGSTQQITKAMNLVSASKVQKAKAKLEMTRPFFNSTRDVITNIINGSRNIKHKFLQKREVKNVTTLVIAGDRGLCGGYNTNVCRIAREFNRKNPKHDYLLIGSKARDFFKRRNKTILHTHLGISEEPFYEDAVMLGKKLMELYSSGETDEIYLAYTEFHTILWHEPKLIRLFPLCADDFKNETEIKQARAIMKYEPNEETVLDYVIPKYINTVIYGALIESAACQQGARMTAMDSATENASEMITKYTTQYNRARQGAITQEITEIISGANALE